MSVAAVLEGTFVTLDAAIAAAAQPAELVALAPALLDRAHALFAACATFQASIAFDASAVIGGRRGGDAAAALVEAARYVFVSPLGSFYFSYSSRRLPPFS
jgi:hypothetical protein